MAKKTGQKHINWTELIAFYYESDYKDLNEFRKFGEWKGKKMRDIPRQTWHLNLSKNVKRINKTKQAILKAKPMIKDLADKTEQERENSLRILSHHVNEEGDPEVQAQIEKLFEKTIPRKGMHAALQGAINLLNKGDLTANEYVKIFNMCRVSLGLPTNYTASAVLVDDNRDQRYVAPDNIDEVLGKIVTANVSK